MLFLNCKIRTIYTCDILIICHYGCSMLISYMYTVWNGYFYQVTCYYLTFLRFLLLFFFVYLLVFLWMKHSKSTLSHLKVHHIVANCSHHVVEEIIEFIPPERFPARKFCLSWQPREVSTAGARTRPNYLLRRGGHWKNTTVHLMNPEESASNSSTPRSLL